MPRKIKFRAHGPYFNKEELDRLVNEICSVSYTERDEIIIDLGAYSYMGLHETQTLLLILRELSRTTTATKWLRLPLSNGVLKFLERWNFFQELKEQSNEYYIDKITVGVDKKWQPQMEGLNKLSRSTRFKSNRVLEITQIKYLSDALDYVTDLHKPELLSVLIGQLRKPLNEVKSFVDIIIFELLKNVIHHVLAYEIKYQDRPASIRLGLIGMQTFDKELIDKFDFDNYLKCWPNFLTDFISENRNGMVELSVVDDGAGFKDTLKKYYSELNVGKKLEHDIDALRFACEAGTSRYKSMRREDIKQQYEEIVQELSTAPQANKVDIISKYIDKLNDQQLENKVDTGYGMYLVAQKVQDWGGVLLLKSGNAYYSPNIPTTEKSHEETLATPLAGVQARILLPIK